MSPPDLEKGAESEHRVGCAVRLELHDVESLFTHSSLPVYMADLLKAAVCVFVCVYLCVCVCVCVYCVYCGDAEGTH